jgi:hypothetical protein
MGTTGRRCPVCGHRNDERKTAKSGELWEDGRSGADEESSVTQEDCDHQIKVDLAEWNRWQEMLRAVGWADKPEK